MDDQEIAGSFVRVVSGESVGSAPVAMIYAVRAVNPLVAQELVRAHVGASNYGEIQWVGEMRTHTADRLGLAPDQVWLM